MSGSSVLFDDLGPRGRRNVRIVSVLSGIIVLALLALALKRFADAGQLDAARWTPFEDRAVWRFLVVGLENTAKAAAVAMLLSLIVGAVMALGRLAKNRPVRWIAGVYVELFRALPLLLMILFIYLALPRYGVDINAFWALVLGLTLYNGAMLAEVFRAGILSLDRGQNEAATSLGLSYWQSMLSVVIPQAGRRMVPAILSQLVALLKDTALGYVITYEELLRRARIGGDFYGNALQMLLVVAVIYFLVNFTLSRLASRLEVRQRRHSKAASVDAGPTGGIAAVQAQQ